MTVACMGNCPIAGLLPGIGGVTFFDNEIGVIGRAFPLAGSQSPLPGGHFKVLDK